MILRIAYIYIYIYTYEGGINEGIPMDPFRRMRRVSIVKRRDSVGINGI